MRKIQGTAPEGNKLSRPSSPGWQENGGRGLLPIPMPGSGQRAVVQAQEHAEPVASQHRPGSDPPDPGLAGLPAPLPSRASPGRVMTGLAPLRPAEVLVTPTVSLQRHILCWGNSRPPA